MKEQTPRKERATEPGVRDESQRACPVPLPDATKGGRISHAIFRLARLHRMLAGQLLRRTGLHPGQELLMMHLWETGPQRQADLIAVLDSDSATMARAVQRLERAGFVRRTPCATDRRSVIIEPTAASLGLRREVELIWRQLEQLAVQDFSEDEETAALQLLERLERNLTAATTPPPCT
jgi:MarR family transcriptional regulator, organic hydroperoxide resistance regulator